MKIQLVQFSTVIVGKSHNPTLLNPDFLSIRRIVPDSWGWEVSPNLLFTTPAASQVVYASRVSITVDPSKLQVIDLGEDPATSKIVDIAKGYVNTLPNIRYTAVGINFQSIIEMASPADYLKDRFVKSGPWDNEARPVIEVGLRLVYITPDGGRLVLSLDAGRAEDTEAGESKPHEVILANANFHRDCQGYPAESQVLKHLDRFVDDWTTYQSILKDTLGDKEK